MSRIYSYIENNKKIFSCITLNIFYVLFLLITDFNRIDPTVFISCCSISIILFTLLLILKISNYKIRCLLLFVSSLLSLNPLSMIMGFSLYKENDDTNICASKTWFIIAAFMLIFFPLVSDLSMSIIKFILSATPKEKIKIEDTFELIQIILSLLFSVLVIIKDTWLIKLKPIIRCICIVCIPICFSAAVLGFYGLSLIKLIEYYESNKKNNDELPNNTLLSIRNVDISFPRSFGEYKVVENLNIDIYKGETLGLVGESGSGKTTIGRAVIGVNKVGAGKIIFHNQVISGTIPNRIKKDVRKNIQMIFQDPAASLNERTTVDYIISEGLRSFHLYKNDKERQEKVNNAIKSVGLLPEHLSRYPHEFSGGQRQRIGIARAIVMEPELIIADEPISALDVSIRAQVLNLLKKFQKEKGLTYLFIAHDLSVVKHIADRIAVIYKGKIVELATSEELFNNPIHPYTKSLLSAIPIPDPKLEKTKKIIKYTYEYKEGRKLIEVSPNHFVYLSEEEIK